LGVEDDGDDDDDADADADAAMCRMVEVYDSDSE
jgi:hypothetical protein